VDLRNNNWFEDGFHVPGKEETGESSRFAWVPGFLESPGVDAQCPFRAS
jgi:hypothetical protein